MDIIGITERVRVCMSLEAESKQAVKIEVLHKKHIEKNAFIFGMLFFLPFESHRF